MGSIGFYSRKTYLVNNMHNSVLDDNIFLHNACTIHILCSVTDRHSDFVAVYGLKECSIHEKGTVYHGALDNICTEESQDIDSRILTASQSGSECGVGRDKGSDRRYKVKCAETRSSRVCEKASVTNSSQC